MRLGISGYITKPSQGLSLSTKVEVDEGAIFAFGDYRLTGIDLYYWQLIFSKLSTINVASLSL